jgi:hypothetical protein
MGPASVLVDETQDKMPAAFWWSQISSLLLIIFELCWVVPWFRTMMGLSTAGPLLESALVLGAVMAASFFAMRFLISLRLLRKVQLSIMAGLLVISLIFAEILLLEESEQASLFDRVLQLDLGVLIIAGIVFWLWWRGYTLANEGYRPALVWRRFQQGVFGFMIYLFYQIQWGKATPSLGWFICFLFVGLLAVIFSRISYVGIARGSEKSPFDRRWLLGIIGVLIAVLILAGAIGSLLSGQYRLVLDLVALLVRWAGVLFLLILSVPAVLVSFILWPLVSWLVGVLQGVPMRPINAMPSAGPYPYPMAQEQGPPAIMFYLQSICLWGGLILLALVLLMRIRQAQGMGGPIEPEAPESLLGEGETNQLLRKALQDAVDGLLARLRPAQRWMAAERIRRVYQQLMERCTALQHPRPPSTTPLEFLPELNELFPGKSDDLEIITRAYIRIRYGEYPETNQEVDQVELAWKRIAEAQ